jgi:hypothetical protein
MTSVNIFSDISEPLRDFGPLADQFLPATFSLVPLRDLRANVLVQSTDSALYGNLFALPLSWEALTCSILQVVVKSPNPAGRTVCDGDQ